MLQSITPVLYTHEMEATIHFYRKVLGFSGSAYHQGMSWTILHRDGVSIMLSLPNAHIPFHQPQFTGSFYIRTDQVDVLWNEWKDTCKVCYPIEDFDYGMREFAIYDNNGYLLQFGQDIFSSPIS
jgi:uncharacterized glyoxalase superfamily protein PhnB